MSAPEIAEIPPGLQKAQKADPQGMALRSPPRPVVRLNRRVLVILVGLLATLVLGATLRAKDNLRHEVVATHAKEDCTIRMPVSPRARKLAPGLPLWWQARLIEVTLAGRTRRFMTPLCDPKRYPAKQLADLYLQRWEIELGFREIKQSLQANNFVLRSKQPALVRQEIWGVLIAYTLLRRQMRLMVPPVRIGFHVIGISTARSCVP
ncbi:MAG: transposase [Acidovorax defluvii]